MRVEDASVVSVLDKKGVGRGKAEEVGVAFEVEAHDAHSLLFAFLDELLFRTTRTCGVSTRAGGTHRPRQLGVRMRGARGTIRGRGARAGDGDQGHHVLGDADRRQGEPVDGADEGRAAEHVGRRRRGAKTEREAAGDGVGKRGANAELFVIVDI